MGDVSPIFSPDRGQKGRSPVGGPRPASKSAGLQLAQQVFCSTLLLLKSALVLVGTPLGLLVLVAGYGPSGLLHAALGLVHRSLVLVFLAVWHDYFPSLVSLCVHALRCGAPTPRCADKGPEPFRAP